MTVNTGALQLSGFDQWDSATYLTDYYSRVERDEQLTLEFLLQEFKRIEPPAVALEFGVGPTLHHALALSPYVTEIHAADYLRANLHQVRSWMLRQRAAHDWKPFTRHILACEGGAEATEPAVRRRETLTRGRVKRLLWCDAAQPVPIPAFRGIGYDVVVSCYCAESATADRSTWRRYMTNIFGLLRPGGLFVMAALRKCRRYKVGDKYFPCADVDETDVATLFEQCGFDMRRTRLRVEPVPEQRTLGYEGILLASGTLARQAARTSQNRPATLQPAQGPWNPTQRNPNPSHAHRAHGATDSALHTDTADAPATADQSALTASANGVWEAQVSITESSPSLLLARGIQARQ